MPCSNFFICINSFLIDNMIYIIIQRVKLRNREIIEIDAVTHWQGSLRKQDSSFLVLGPLLMNSLPSVLLILLNKAAPLCPQT